VEIGGGRGKEREGCVRGLRETRGRMGSLVGGGGVSDRRMDWEGGEDTRGGRGQGENGVGDLLSLWGNLNHLTAALLVVL